MELQLRRWYRERYTDKDLTPHLVLDRTERALARLQSKHVKEVEKHLQKLKEHTQYFRQHPMNLFAGEKRKSKTVKKKAAKYVPKLTKLTAILTHVLEDTSRADAEVADVPSAG